MILTAEQPSPTQDHLYNPNATEMVIGGLREIVGFPLKGLNLNLYKATVDKVFCLFEHGNEPEVDFFTLFETLETEIFGKPASIQTSAETNDWEITWNFRWFSISLFLHRNTADLRLLFSDKSIQRILNQEQKIIFAEYVERQMGNLK